MNLRYSCVALTMCAASVSSTWAGAEQLQLAFQPVVGKVTSGFFPVPVSAANLQNVSGTIQLFQDVNALAFFTIDVNQTGFQAPGQVVDLLEAKIVIEFGIVTSAFFSVIMNDGSFFQAVGATNGSGLDIAFSDGAYTISGAITNFQMDGPLLAGVDVSGPFAAQPLFGSFFDFSFTPLELSFEGFAPFVDFDTQLLFDVSSDLLVVPLPSAVGLGSLGLLALAGRRRRTI